MKALTYSLWKIQAAGWLVYFLLMFLTFLSRETDQTLGYIFTVKLFRTFLGFSLSWILWLLYRHLIKSQSLLKIGLLVVISSAMMGFIWMILETGFFWLTRANYDLLHALQFTPRVALTYTVTLLAWSAIYFGIEYWRRARIEQENALHTKVLAETAQLQLLRYQINPHFLFNALNSIRASIDPHNATAKNMITQLSEFLRHSLMSEDKVENTLAEEVEAIDNYLAIEKIRFEDALDIEWCIAENSKTLMLPSFLLNPLVENAIKHGFATSSGQLKIAIKTQYANNKLVIIIKNTGKLVHPNGNTTVGIGLANVRARLQQYLPQGGTFSIYQEGDWVIAKVEIEVP